MCVDLIADELLGEIQLYLGFSMNTHSTDTPHVLL